MKKTAFVISLLVCASIAISGSQKIYHKDKKESKPSAQEIKALQKIKLTVENQDGDLFFSWTPATSKASGGVKIAYSEKNPEPLYPYDPYVAWIPGNNHSSYLVSNKKAACGKARYYRICSVSPNNHKEYLALSNVVKVDPVESTGGSAKKYEKTSSSKEVSKKTSSSGQMVCPRCGWTGDADDRFCAKCGAKLEQK